MAKYIRLVDQHGWYSPTLKIHHDDVEFMKVILQWRDDLLEHIKKHPRSHGIPLGRLEPGTCMLDLIVTLHSYYIETTPLEQTDGKIVACLKLVDFCPGHENDENNVPITDIKLFK